LAKGASLNGLLRKRYLFIKSIGEKVGENLAFAENRMKIQGLF